MGTTDTHITGGKASPVITFKKTAAALLLVGMSSMASYAQLGKCKGKYLGNIIANDVHANYSSLWNQVTSENGSKWGSCDRGNGNYNFDNSDLAYNWAKDNKGLFKFHTLIWGAQAPGYLATASATDVMNAIKKWIPAVQAHYAPMGGLKMIDVLNEPVNTPIDKELANLKAALTLGYKSEPANAGDLNNPYGWAIWPFQLARKSFPDATLLINEFNIEWDWNSCRATYITMINAIKNAPNLTDGKKNLIDGIGLQAHGMNGATMNLTAAKFKACLDELWTKTSLPIHITELDLVADPNEAAQSTYYQAYFPIAWEHPHVAGITLWGYIQGKTWIPGNKKTGTEGTDSGIQYADLTDRPAMKWLKSYMAAQASLSCCPAPAPFGNCDKGMLPTIKFTAPTQTTFTAPATVPFDVAAADADGTISNINFYIDAATATFHEEWTAPYTFEQIFDKAGTYTIKAVVYDNDGNTAQDVITIKVNVAQGPYGGTAAAVPGKIEFENYDLGGNGFAYKDDAATNSGGATFRTDEDVDIENCTDAGAGYNIGYATKGEWMEYTVNVATAGKYTVTFRAASNGAGKTISLSAKDKVVAADIAIPNTAGWQTWQDVAVKDIALEAGVQVIRVTLGASDYVNLNYMTFALQPAAVPTYQLKAGWNLIGCPIDGSTDVATALTSIWTNVTAVKDMNSLYLKSNPAMLNTLSKLDWGKGYYINVDKACEIKW